MFAPFKRDDAGRSFQHWDSCVLRLYFSHGCVFSWDAPSAGGFPGFDGTPATIYYLAGTTGWSATFAGRPTKLWEPISNLQAAQRPGTKLVEITYDLISHLADGAPVSLFVKQGEMLVCSVSASGDIGGHAARQG